MILRIVLAILKKNRRTKMNKDKMARLTKYQASLKDRQTSPVPAKHVSHPATYKQFLERELATVTKQLDEAKMEGVK